jgi:hypothetical protein
VQRLRRSLATPDAEDDGPRLERTASSDSLGMAAMSSHLTSYVAKKLIAVSAAANSAAAAGGVGGVGVGGGGGARLRKEAAAMAFDLAALEVGPTAMEKLRIVILY